MTGIGCDHVPETEEALRRCLADPHWRIGSGQLYKIMVKGDAEGDTTVIPFRPNRAQRRLLGRLWYRNIILKARQMGFTTVICIAWLDHALFNADQRCGIIAQDRISAEAFFRDKVKFAYDNLPAFLRAQMPLARDSASELLFGHNNSSIRVATSMRSGTIHRLHVSEMGKIGATHPHKAKEIVSGSFQAVPATGITVVESTAEGQEGAFYRMVRKAQALADQGKTLTRADYRLHFFPWFEDPTYRMAPDPVLVTQSDTTYFEQVEAETGVTLSPEQRAWYVAKRSGDFSGDEQLMWQEYPSTAEEAFKVSAEGCYYTSELAIARKQGRIGRVPYAEGVPVDTFWDIGSTDGTGIWFHQRVGPEHRFIRYEEAWGEAYAYFVRLMQQTGYVWGKHYLPHDARHRRQMGDRVASPKDELVKLAPGWNFVVVPRVDEIIHGIQATRQAFSRCWFDEAGCKHGLDHVAAYRKEWNERLQTWRATPRHDQHSEAADALRQFGQALTSGLLTDYARGLNRRARPSGMAA